MWALSQPTRVSTAFPTDINGKEGRKKEQKVAARKTQQKVQSLEEVTAAAITTTTSKKKKRSLANKDTSKRSKRRRKAHKVDSFPDTCTCTCTLRKEPDVLLVDCHSLSVLLFFFFLHGGVYRRSYNCKTGTSSFFFSLSLSFFLSVFPSHQLVKHRATRIHNCDYTSRLQSFACFFKSSWASSTFCLFFFPP